jgi:hypothetical protein
MRLLPLLLALLLPLGCAHAPLSIAPGREIAGTLAKGDSKLESGELCDVYTFDAAAGTNVSVRLESEHFDCYLILIEPDGTQQDNDDFAGETNSQIDRTLTSTGAVQAIVTTYRGGESGDYTFSLMTSRPVRVAPSS